MKSDNQYINIHHITPPLKKVRFHAHIQTYRTHKKHTEAYKYLKEKYPSFD